MCHFLIKNEEFLNQMDFIFYPTNGFAKSTDKATTNP